MKISIFQGMENTLNMFNIRATLINLLFLCMHVYVLIKSVYFVFLFTMINLITWIFQSTSCINKNRILIFHMGEIVSKFL